MVFDVDGTLIDTLPAVQAALDAVLAAAGRPAAPAALVRRHFSTGMRGLLAAAWAPDAAAAAPGTPPVDGGGPPGAAPGAAPDAALEAAFTRAYLARAPELARPFDGVAPMLEALASLGLRLALCSNGSGPALQALLQRHGWAARFGAVVHAGNARALKPSPQPLWQALQALQVPADQAWMVGDSALDGLCAQAAGCPFVWLACGYGDAEAAGMARWRLRGPGELGALLAGTIPSSCSHERTMPDTSARP